MTDTEPVTSDPTKQNVEFASYGRSWMIIVRGKWGRVFDRALTRWVGVSAISMQYSLAGGRPYMTVSQCRVPLRKRRIWRRQAAAVRSSQRESRVWASVVATVVPVLGVVLGLLSLFCEAVAAAAAVAMPANASSSPQARIERRNSITSRVDCKSEAERAGRRPPSRGEHHSARLMRSVAAG